MRSDLNEIKKVITQTSAAALVGVGNIQLADDGFGPYLCGKITNPKISVINAGVSPENFIGKIAAVKDGTVVFLDAADFGKEPGCAAFVNEEDMQSFSFSSHSMPLSAMLKILRSQAPNAQYLILGVQPGDTGYLKPMTLQVKQTADCLAKVFNSL